MARILAVSDEIEAFFYYGGIQETQPHVVISCGDLPFDYLEYIVTVARVPLLYVLGNHDPDIDGRAFEIAARTWERQPRGPAGCTNIDGRTVEVAGMRICGLGGSRRYSEGPNQYSEAEMRRRVQRLRAAWRLRRPFGDRGIDVFVAHSPPRGVGDEDDQAHQGFEAFHPVLAKFRPKLMLHGHVHPFGRQSADRRVGSTLIVNTVGYRLMEI